LDGLSAVIFVHWSYSYSPPKHNWISQISHTTKAVVYILNKRHRGI